MGRNKKVKKCVNCGKEHSNHDRITCSEKCYKERLSLGGNKTVKANRPIGPDHHLWKGGSENRKAWKKHYKDKFPERVKARQAVSDAVRRKKIEKEPCAICGEKKSEAHHEDYSKPLQIIWLCRKHHREADKKMGIGSSDF